MNSWPFFVQNNAPVILLFFCWFTWAKVRIVIQRTRISVLLNKRSCCENFSCRSGSYLIFCIIKVVFGKVSKSQKVLLFLFILVGKKLRFWTIFEITFFVPHQYNKWKNIKLGSLCPPSRHQKLLIHLVFFNIFHFFLTHAFL